MKVDIKVPAVGESITEATIAEWLKKDGDQVKKNEVLLSLETDKATVEVVSENDGKLTTTAKAGDVVQIGSVVGSVDTDAAGAAPSAPAASAPAASAPAANAGTPPPVANTPAAPAQAAYGGSSAPAAKAGVNEVLSPAVRRVVDERGLDPAQIQGSGKDGRILKYDAETAPAGGAAAPAPKADVTTKAPAAGGPAIPTVPGQSRRVPMTTIRKRIAERLVEAQHTAAILTTFNEVDMSAVMGLREKYKEAFKEKYGVGLGFMGFFVKACV